VSSWRKASATLRTQGIDTRSDAVRVHSRHGIRTIGRDGVQPRDIILTGIALTGEGPSRLLAANTDRLGFRATGWSVDGDPVSDEAIAAGLR
jgi:hypothetical protein